MCVCVCVANAVLRLEVEQKARALRSEAKPGGEVDQCTELKETVVDQKKKKKKT